MTMTAAMAAALTVLTEALDDPGSDVAHSIELLSSHAQAAVPSFCGLSVVVPQSDPPFAVTALTDGAEAIRTSLQFRLPQTGDPRSSLVAEIILFAGSPGALVDLAADLAWLTARPLGDFVLDRHVAHATASPQEGHVHGASAINQAIGVLIGRGYTSQQADWQLDVHAADSGIDRAAAARRILAELTEGNDHFDGH